MHTFNIPADDAAGILDSKEKQVVRCRAPLRLGLAGGGTDVSPYSDEYGGVVLNATIRRYAFAFIEKSPDDQVHFRALDLDIAETFAADLEAVKAARLRLHAAVYRRFMTDFAGGRPLPITIRTQIDAPAGSGLGSSSALVVAMVEAYCRLLDIPLGLYEMARLAYEIERIDLGLSGGKQDQYAAAFGGLNFIEFNADDKVIVNPLRLHHSTLCELESSLITCFSGVSRQSADIIDQQRSGMQKKAARTIDSLHQLKACAIDMKMALLQGKLERMGDILNESWKAKKATAAGVSTGRIDALYGAAMDAGAVAGKVSGAGGGGFIMFLAPPKKRLQVIQALNAAGGTAEGATLVKEGVESWIVPKWNS